jgi:hypothetical protein
MYKNNKPIVIGDKPFLYALYMDSGFHRPVHTGDATSQMSALKLATGGIAQVQQEVPQSPAPDGPPSGIIGGAAASPEESVADDVPMEVPEGAFIINAAAAEVAGYGDIKKMIMSAIGVAKRLGIEVAAGNNETSEEEAVDLLVSKGEVYIEPTLAKIIGYDVLEKINNRGKKEVARRQQEAEASQEQQAEAPQAPMQRGGFVKKKFAEGGDVNSEEGLVERIADFLITPLNEGEEEQLAQIKSEAEARKQGESFGDVEAGFDILNRYKTNRANLYIPEGSDAVEEGYNSTWDPVLQLALSDPKGLSGFVSEKPMDENVYGAYEPKSNDIRMSSQEYGTDKKMSYVDTLTHELMHKGQYESGSAPVDFDNFGDMIERNRYLHAVISKKLMLDSLYKMQSAKTEKEKSLYKKSFEHNIDMLTGVYMPAIPEFKEKIKDKSILADMYTGDITPAEAATEVYNLFESSPTATAIERDAEARAMYRLSENRKTATQKRAQGFAEGGDVVSTDEEAVTRILNENSKLNFVQRILTPEKAPAPIEGEGGVLHTHLMRAEYLGPNGTQPAVFPEVIEQDGKLVHLTLPQAVEHARRTGEYILFDNIKDADTFSQNYKTSGFKNYYKPNQNSSGFIPKN